MKPVELPSARVTAGHNFDSGVSVVLCEGHVLTIDERGLVHDRELDFTPERFTHAGPLTAVLGLEGALVLYGHEVVQQVRAFGPHAFVDGRLRVSCGYPDVGGAPAPGLVEPHLGTPLIRGLYRGLPLLVTGHPDALTLWGSLRTPRAYVPPPISSQLYTRSPRRYAAFAVPEGLVYSTDDTRSWHLRETPGLPVPAPAPLVVTEEVVEPWLP